MEKVVFEKNWSAFFEKHGLKSFDDFYHYQQGDVINENTKRNVFSFELSDGEKTETFFMKRFHSPHFKDILFTFRNYGVICSQAELEWRNANKLLDNQIETYHPVAFGCRSVCSIEKQSFFITRQINGQSLLDYLIACGGDLGQDELATLVKKLAQFFRKIHAARFSLPDSYIWHVYLIRSGDALDDYELGMIDLHRMQISTRGNHEAAMNLGRFLFSLPEDFLDESLKKSFLEHYLETDFSGNKDAFLHEVKKWEIKLSKRRKKTPPLSHSIPDKP